MRPTLILIGNFSQPWHTEVHLARDAEAAGCEVVKIEEAEVHEQLSRVGPERFRLKGVGQLAGTSSDPAVMLYMKTNGLPANAVELWRRFERAGGQTASFHLDLYVGLSRQSQVGLDPFWHTGTVFTADGDPASQHLFQRLNINHRWCPPGIVSDEAIPTRGRATGDRGERIIFVGSTRGYHEQWPWRLEMLAALRQRYGQHFGSYGPQEGTLIRGLDLNRLYQRAGRIVIGDSLALRRHAYYFSDRYFETVGRGGFLIGPRVEGITEFLEDGAHFRGYDVGDLPGLFGLIDGYLDEPEECRRIARAGQAHVATHHTYQHRVRAMLAQLGHQL